MRQPRQEGARWARFEDWLGLVRPWVAERPIAEHPAGLARVRDEIRARFERLGFHVATHPPEEPGGQDGHAAVLVATRPPDQGQRWVGCCGHYDIESAGAGWQGDPFIVRIAEERVQARGIGDNLGPLALRLLALEEVPKLPGLVWILQGEEEIGSPWAHRLFPRLELPPVSLWIEETGYFEEDGTQRILARRLPPWLGPAFDRLTAAAQAEGREYRILDRYLNKAFGADQCPFLTHLVGEAPYLAIGPNDTRTRIHAPGESLPLDTLALSARQFAGVLEEVARCA